MFVDEEVEFVKSQIAHHTRSIRYHEGRKDELKARRHRGILRRFEEILSKIELFNEQFPVHPNNEIAIRKIEPIGGRIGNVEDLPEEIRSQLVSVQYDELETQILTVINKRYSGIATIDEILVGLWREHNDVHQRDVLATKIYRMVRKEFLHSVAGRKGVYSTKPIEEAGEATSEEKATGE
ncbi:MAG: hypothetical protein ACR2PC_13415 [Tsuneonella suprasediminis]|nr:hypothetical protein LBX01_10240 [Altererythrobacter sp. N1]